MIVRHKHEPHIVRIQACERHPVPQVSLWGPAAVLESLDRSMRHLTRANLIEDLDERLVLLPKHVGQLHLQPIVGILSAEFPVKHESVKKLHISSQSIKNERGIDLIRTHCGSDRAAKSSTSKERRAV